MTTQLLRMIAALAASAVLAACGRAAPATPGPQQATRDSARAGMRPYARVVTRDAVTDDGLFRTHRIGEKLLYEIPNAELGRELLLVTRVARTANQIGYGGEEVNTQVVRWERQSDRVLLRIVSYENVAADSLPIYQAVRNSNFEPIVRAFPIQAMSPDSQRVVIEVTDLFTKDVPLLGLEQSRRENFKVRRLDESRSFIESVRSFPRNIEVRNVLTYEAAEPPSNSSTGTISVEMNHSMVLLPERPMTPRPADPRVGYFGVQMTDYGADAQRAQERRYITRWRLEPKDTAAFLRGELVEPIKPIVYYIDPATPMKWRPYLKQGVEDWNSAFEAAGFRNAIVAKDPPSAEEDPEFSPEDARYSVIRYFSSPIQNAYGPHVHDPRTGEILESDIGWYHNVMNLLRNWYFVQTAAANPAARNIEFDDEVMGRLIRFVSAHEVGHTLGLPHNMKASASYPVDSLRSASFTRRMGTAPSIMDYARFNYVAQPGDTGVSFLPDVGPYDRYAIMWGYRPIIGADTPEAQRDSLNAWVRRHESDPMFRFGNPSSIDPSSLTEAIGDDAMKAGYYGIENLKRIVPNLIQWTYREGEPYEQLGELYNQVIAQWNRYMGHVVANIGGVYQTRRTYDQPGAVYEVVPEATQREAMRFLVVQAFRTPEWMLEEPVLQRIEHAGAVERIRRLQVQALNNVLEPQRMQRLVEAEARHGERAYTLEEMLAGVRDGVWSELRTGASTDAYRRNLQRGWIERMEWLMREEPAAPSQFAMQSGNFTAVDVSQSDIRAFARGELDAVRARMRAALPRVTDRATRLHLQDALVRIDTILDPRLRP